MKALTWHGKGDIRCDSVPDPKIQDGRDAIIEDSSLKVTFSVPPMACLAMSAQMTRKPGPAAASSPTGSECRFKGDA
jgi:hypothetical protein